MPAMLDDPTSPPIFRRSGNFPYPDAESALPQGLVPIQVTLRDRVTRATLIPFAGPHEVPKSLLVYLCDQLAREIELGNTYPMLDPLPPENFGPYWFANFGAVMVLGSYSGVEELNKAANSLNWERDCMGSFYVKPNYPGRSSHVCNGGFLVTDGARNRGVGRLMGEAYLEWAPKLGYTYSVFNLVYETNVASCRIWDALGFKRIGRVPGCGNLRSHPDELIDAIIYGRELGAGSDDLVSEERFDKIRFYLQHGKYPDGADRAEKSRLRSAATHYKLAPADHRNETPKLMLKGKEVISDPSKQYEIASQIHQVHHHGGINKCTSKIAERYHWIRIKETVNLVIRNCTKCKEQTKFVSPVRPAMTSHMEEVAQPFPVIDQQNAVEHLAHLRDNENCSTVETTGHILKPAEANTLSSISAASVSDRHNMLTSFPDPHELQSAYTFDPDIPLDPQLMHGILSTLATYNDPTNSNVEYFDDRNTGILSHDGLKAIEVDSQSALVANRHGFSLPGVLEVGSSRE